MIKKISDAVNIPSEDLEDWGIPKTIGEPKCQLRGFFISENPKMVPKPVSGNVHRENLSVR